MTLSWARFISVPENRAALLAVRTIAAGLCPVERQGPNPVFLYGPTGSGKSYLVSALVDQVRAEAPQTATTVLQAVDLETLLQASPPLEKGVGSSRTLISPAEIDGQRFPTPLSGLADPLEPVQQSDLLVVEDLDQFGRRTRSSQARLFEKLVQLVDHLREHQRQMVFTARVGPGDLRHFPSRLTTRLSGGLVIGIPAYGFSSRLELLREKAQRRQLPLTTEVLVWIARRAAGSVRQLDGALAQAETLGRQFQRLPDVALLDEHWACPAEAGSPSIEGIADRVSDYFGVDREQVQSKQRYRELLLPRQLSMYLARQLTGLSLAEIGSFFGGRDHTTVLHACRKVEQTLCFDPVLSGAIRELHSDLE
jgi:chromosomal replication initiator protein